MYLRESSPSSASVSNEGDDFHGIQSESVQGSSAPAESTFIFENVPQRARNVYQAPPPEIPMNMLNQPVAPVVHIDTTDLARTMATVIVERKRYRKPGDIIEHAKKCGAYDFYGTLDPGQADKWVKTVEKAFNTLQLNDVKKVNNVYDLIFEKAGN